MSVEDGADLAKALLIVTTKSRAETSQLVPRLGEAYSSADWNLDVGSSGAFRDIL